MDYRSTSIPHSAASRRTGSPEIHDNLFMQCEYTIGETEFECWDRLWKACASDPDVDGEEWVSYLAAIQEHFHNSYENFHDEFYFWGDFSGDRTLDLKIAKPAVLTVCLLTDLQKYLQLNGEKMWRIRIPIYFKADDPHRVIVVYSDALDIPSLYLGVTALRRDP
jgi:hypothetical protein